MRVRRSETSGKREKTREERAQGKLHSSFLIPHSSFHILGRKRLIPHLENCTGKNIQRSTEARKIPVRSADVWNSQIRLQPFLNSLRKAVAVEARSSEKERRVDAKALIADEGRDKLR